MTLSHEEVDFIIKIHDEYFSYDKTTTAGKKTLFPEMKLLENRLKLEALIKIFEGITEDEYESSYIKHKILTIKHFLQDHKFF